MLYKILVVLHLIGACVWIGGHAALIGAVLPIAMAHRDPGPIRDFERSFGRIGLASLAIQLATGLWLTAIRFGGLTTVLREPSAAGHLVLAKLLLLVALFGLAGHAYHRVLPHLSPERLAPFAAHAWAATVLSVLTLIAGAGVRLGGLF